MTNFEFNEGAMSDFLVGAQAKLVDAYQHLLDDLSARYQGRPLDEVKAALAAAWPTVADGHISDPELTVWAQAISDGKPITMTPGEIRG